MVWGLQMRKGQKIGIACVFCLGLVIAIFDILRTVESLASGTFSGVALWSCMEVSMAVIVASLPTYRTLIGFKTRKSTARYSNSDRYKRLDKSNTRKGSTVSDSALTDPSRTFTSTDEEVLESQSPPPQKSPSPLSSIPLAHLVAPGSSGSRVSLSKT